MANQNVIIQAMHGLGDNIYQRAFMHAFPGATVMTPWPEVYGGLDVKCARPSQTKLRTQCKNLARTQHPWSPIPPGLSKIYRPRYGFRELAQGSIIDAMRATFDAEPVFDLPRFPAPFQHDKPIAVVRPVTIRKEWRNEARAPRPEYVRDASKVLRDRGYHVVSLADVDGTNEWLVSPNPVADQVIHDGSLNVSQLLGLVQSAAVVVGGVGWIVPACIAARTPLYGILGGNGAHNRPEVITDPATMDLSRVSWATPRNFCQCANNLHNCDKVIHGFADQFDAWLQKHVF